MWRRACGYGVSNIPTGGRVRAGSQSRRPRVSSRGARHWFWTRLLRPSARPRCGRLDARPPTAVVVLKPDHVRDVDLFVHRYSARAFGPRLFFREDIPETKLEWIEPGSQLPGGIVALYDARGRNETPLWLPEQRTLVFADGAAGGAVCLGLAVP